MTGRLGGGHPVADQCESGTQFLLIELWSARVPPHRAGGRHAVTGSLGDYLWNEIDYPLERFRPFRANHFSSKGFVFP